MTFLGTAGSFPTVERSAPSIAVRRKGELLLFDCGEGTQRQMFLARVGFRPRMKVFITHMHGDHILGLPGLLQTKSLFDVKSELQIFGPEGIYAFVKAMRKTVRFRLTFPVLVKEVGEGFVCREEEYSVHAVWAEHVVPNLAYALIERERPGKFYPEKARALGVPEGPLWSRLQRGERVTLPSGKVVSPEQVVGPARRGRKVVYSGDTRPCEAVKRLAEGADLLIHEATLDDALAAKSEALWHSTARQAAELAREAGVRRLVLTHISGRYRDTDVLLGQAREVFPRVMVAEDLTELVVRYPD